MAASDTVTDDSIAWMLGKAVELNLMRDGVIKLYITNGHLSGAYYSFSETASQKLGRPKKAELASDK